MHANAPGCVPFTSSTTSPPSSDAQHASGERARDPDRAFARRGTCRRRSRPSAAPRRGGSRACRRRAMSNALMRLAMLSPTSRVEPSAVMTEPFGNASPSAATRAAPVGLDQDQRSVSLRLLARVHVEPEVADVGAAVRVDHHVVAQAGRERGEIGVHDERAVGLEPQHACDRASRRRAAARRAASRAPTAAAAPRRSSRRCRRRSSRPRACRAGRRTTADRRASAALPGTRGRRGSPWSCGPSRSGPYSVRDRSSCDRD